MTFRELRVLITQLPEGSRLGEAEQGEAATWTRQEWMLADLIDVAQMQRYLAEAKATRKPGKPPKPYPRPQQDRAKSLSPRLEQWRQRHVREGDDGC